MRDGHLEASGHSESSFFSMATRRSNLELTPLLFLPSKRLGRGSGNRRENRQEGTCGSPSSLFLHFSSLVSSFRSTHRRLFSSSSFDFVRLLELD